MHLKKCDYCQEEFQAIRISANYCSASCRQLAYVQRLENKNEEEEEEENEDEENYEDLEDENEELEEEKIEPFSPFSEEELDDMLPDEESLWADDDEEYLPSNEVKKRSIPNKEVQAEISDKESRQVNASRIFINYLAHLKNIYGQSVKVESFMDSLTCFQELRNDYIKRSSKEYSLYPFANDLENIIIELESYIVKYVKRKDKRICFDLGEEYLSELEEIEQELEGYNYTILQRYK